jgi:hypothetical protein
MVRRLKRIQDGASRLAPYRKSRFQLSSQTAHHPKRLSERYRSRQFSILY